MFPRLTLLGKELLSLGRLGQASNQLTSLRSLEDVTLYSAGALRTLRPWGAMPGWERIVSLLPNLLDIQLMAVPKRKVTPSRKGMRSANKHIRFIPTVARCSQCDKIFPQHAMPSKCEEDGCPAFHLRERPPAK